MCSSRDGKGIHQAAKDAMQSDRNIPHINNTLFLSMGSMHTYLSIKCEPTRALTKISLAQTIS
jgi:hypothetical protein